MGGESRMFLIKSLREFTSRGSGSKRRRGESGGRARGKVGHASQGLQAPSFQPSGVLTAAGSEPLRALCADGASEAAGFPSGNGSRDVGAQQRRLPLLGPTSTAPWPEPSCRVGDKAWATCDPLGVPTCALCTVHRSNSPHLTARPDRGWGG